MSELREKVADAIAGAVSQDDRYLEHADAVLRVLAEHGDTQQVGEQIRDAIRTVATPIGGDPAKTPVWEPLFDAIMAVVAPHLAARDAAVEQVQMLAAELASVVRQENEEFVELVAARQQLDQVRASVMALPYGQTGGTKWLPDFEIGWLHCRQDVLAILGAPARPAGHDETGQ
jgi:hypothetical protein